ncbi:MAG: ATP-binding protein [Clostridia bacterium]
MLLAKMGARLVIRVIINIVDNAVKYTQLGSTVEVSARRAGEMAGIAISDDESGIAEEPPKCLFDMFYTGETAPSDSCRGLGLTLYQSIILAHGGTLGVYDNQPMGSVFRFTLPVSDVASCACIWNMLRKKIERDTAPPATCKPT